MNKAQRIFHILSCAYIIFTLAFFIVNRFSLIKYIDKHHSQPDCSNLKLENFNSNTELSRDCLEEMNSITSIHFTWFTWQFYSNNRGSDKAHYIPVDVVLLVFANGIVYLVFRNKQKEYL